MQYTKDGQVEVGGRISREQGLEGGGAGPAGRRGRG